MIDALAPALRRVYGDSPLLPEQLTRYQRAMAEFTARYGPGPMLLFRSPGRVNLIGEHTDYNHGFVLPLALDKDLLIVARPRQDGRVRMQNIEADFPPADFSLAESIPHHPIGHWANYAQGPAELLCREYGPRLVGMDALVDGAAPYGVPRGAGLSSSSALTVATAVALVAINKLPLSGVALADLCGRAEWYVGTRGGVMDQFIAILAENGHALFLDCRPTGDGAEYRYRHVPVPSGYAVVVIDSGVRHQNTGPHFNLRVAEGRIGVHLLKSRYPGITHLRDVQDVPWNELEHLLPETIDREGLRAAGIDLDEVLGGGILPDAAEFRVRRRCRHVLSENYRVLEAVAAMEANDISRFGHLLRQAHASARDDYEISTPEIETLIFVAQEIPGVIGARLTGAGWGGCVVALVAQESLPTLTERVTIPYHRRTGREATVFVCRSAAGAGAVR